MAIDSNDRDPNEYEQLKTYNSPAAGYNVPAKGANKGADSITAYPEGLTGDKGLLGIPDSLPNENPSVEQANANKVFDKLK